MLQAQQEFINDLKKMIARLLKSRRRRQKVRRLNFLPAKARIKRRRMKALPPNNLMVMKTTLDKILSFLLLKN